MRLYKGSALDAQDRVDSWVDLIISIGAGALILAVVIIALAIY